MTGMDDLHISDDAFLNALRKIESSYEEDANLSRDDSVINTAPATSTTTTTINNNGKDDSNNIIGANKNLACSCVITLCKILDNIILEKKYNAKTRSIKLSNKLFKDKVGKVQGGVDFMMACKFTYNTAQPTQGHHSIQLKKQNEDRNVLIMGRKYLDQYGQKLLQLHIGKHRNELPPYLIRDKVHDIDQMIERGIMTLKNDKLKSLESEISSIIGEEDDDVDCCFNLDTTSNKDLMDVVDSMVVKDHHPKDYGNTSSPSTLETEKTDATGDQNDDEGDNQDTPTDMIITAQNGINTNDDFVVKTNPLVEQDEADESTTEEETLEKSQHSTKSLDLISEGCKSDHSAILDDVVSNNINEGVNPISPIHKSFEFNTDEQIQQIDIQCLSTEKKALLNKLTNINLQGLGEDEAIISIIEGNNLNQSDKKSRSYSFVSKLKNLAGRGRSNEDEKAEETNKNSPNEDDMAEYVTKPQVTIRESDDVRKIYEKDPISSPSSEVMNINFAEKIDSVKLGRALPEDEENAIRFGLKFFFVVFVNLFNQAPLYGEESCCPIEIVFRLWKAILRTELSLNGIQTHKILQAFEALVVGINEDENDFQIGGDFETLSGLDLKTCHFIQAVLVDIGVIRTKSMDNYFIKDDMDSFFTFTSIAMSGGPYSFERRKEIAGDVLPSIGDQCSKWHDIIVRGCKEMLSSELSTEELFNDPEPSNRLSLWYANRHLPFHIMSYGSYKDALALLLDRSFTLHRLNSCGCVPATVQHLRDAFMTKEAMIQNDDSNFMNVDYQQAAVRAIQEQILEILEEKKKHIDELLKKSIGINTEETISYKERALDIGRALHKVGASFGQSGWHQKEIDVYSEALRLKLASESTDDDIVDTLLSMSVCYRKLDDSLNALSRLDDVLKIEISLKGEIDSNIGVLTQYKGLIQCQLGYFNEALHSFQTTLRIYKVLNTRSGIVTTLCWIGKTQQELGEHLLALDSFQTAKSSLEMIDQPDILRHAEILQNIGIIYGSMNKLQESLHYLYEGLKIRRSVLGDDSAEVCETLSIIATVLKKKDFDKALTIFRIVLNVKLKQYTMKDANECEDLLKAYLDVLLVAKEMLRRDNHNQDLHDEVTMLFFSIGNVYEKLQRYKTAIGYYNKALKIQKIRKQYYEIGNVLNSLGIAHAKRRSFKKASRCLADCLSLRKLVLGERNMEVAETLHNMGNCCAKQSDFDNAAIHYEQSLIIKRMIDGESLSTAKTLHTIGLVNEEIGLLDDAFKYYEDSYKIRLAQLGESSLDVAFSLHSIGLVHRKKEEINEAHDCFTKALKVKKQHYFIDHVSIAETLRELAIVDSKREKYHEAIVNYESALTIYEKSLGAHKNTAKILDSLGSLFLSTEQFNHAYRHLERALALKRILFGDDDEEVSDTLHLIGKVQCKSGDIDDALDSLKEALRIRKKIYDDDSLPIVAIINDVGVLQLRKNQYQIAKTCFTEALRFWKLKLDDYHDYHSEALMNLAEIDHLSGDYDEAISKLTEALNLMKTKVGERHTSVGLIYYKLGLSFKAKEEYIDGLDALERSLTIRSDEYGQNSLQVAEVLKCIGTLCLAMGELAKARNYLGESLKIMNSIAPNNFETADILHSLGRVMSKMRYLEEAKTYFQQALEIRKIQTDDAVNADIISDLGAILEEKQQYEESLNMYEKSLKIRIALYGENSSIGDSYHMIGNIHQTMNQYESALSNFGSALVVYQNTVGDDHLSCAKTMNNIAIVYEATNDLDEAIKYHREALRIRKKNLGRDHLKVANSLDNIAGVYQKQNNVDKACSALKEALRIRIAKLGNDHLEVGTTLFGMGILYCEKGDLLRAMDCYEASLKIRKRRVGPSSIEVAQTIFNIGSLHAMKQDYNNALNSWRNALEIYRITLPDDHHMVACAIGNIQMAENVLSGGA